MLFHRRKEIMSKRLRIFIGYILAAIFAAFLSGCSVTPQASVNDLEEIDCDPSGASVPFKLAVFSDVTLSSAKTRTKQLTVDDFEPVISRLEANGGELAVGLIS